MNLIRIKNASYDRYEELLIKRDTLEQEADSILISYTCQFGELITAIFEEKIACIRKKKAIAYCQTQINRGTPIDTEEMQSYLDENMALYYHELNAMLRRNEDARNAKTITIADEQRSKKLYRRLAKMLHPDINPQTLQVELLADLWNRIAAAYRALNPIELSNLEVLVNKAISDLGLGTIDVEIPDIEQRIRILEEEINQILTTEPYIWRTLLADEMLINEKKSELEKELEEYKQYQEKLDTILNNLITQGGVTLQWRMN